MPGKPTVRFTIEQDVETLSDLNDLVENALIRTGADGTAKIRPIITWKGKIRGLEITLDGSVWRQPPGGDGGHGPHPSSGRFLGVVE